MITDTDRSELDRLLKAAAEAVAKMTPEDKAAMYEAQRQSWVRGEMGWSKPKFKWVNGVKVYDSYSDYCND